MYKKIFIVIFGLFHISSGFSSQGQPHETLLTCVVTVEQKLTTTGNSEKNVEKINVKIRQDGKKIAIWSIDGDAASFSVANYRFNDGDEILDKSNEGSWRILMKRKFQGIQTTQDLILDRVTGKIKFETSNQYDKKMRSKGFGSGSNTIGFGECSKAASMTNKF